jgi:hypothetical protein
LGFDFPKEPSAGVRSIIVGAARGNSKMFGSFLQGHPDKYAADLVMQDCCQRFNSVLMP